MKNPKRQPDAARRAKLTIQRRTLALLLVFGVVSFAALFRSEERRVGKEW